jgi:hypothetical protein
LQAEGSTQLAKQEPQDPLKLSMEMDDEELEYEPDTINQQVGYDFVQRAWKLKQNLLQLKVQDTNVSNEIEATDNLSLGLAEFSLPPPKRYTNTEIHFVVASVLNRLKDSLGEDISREGLQEEKTVTKLKSLLLVRFITRGVEASEEDASNADSSDSASDGQSMKAVVPRLASSLRDKMCDFIMKDLSSR